MEKPEAEYLLDLWHRKICPYCGDKVADNERVGTGKKRDGGFCSLTCYSAYHYAEIVQRQARLYANWSRHRKN